VLLSAGSATRTLGLGHEQPLQPRGVHLWHRPEFRGPEGFKQVVTIYRTAFPDLHITIEDQVTEGDLVAGRFVARGTHHGELMGIPPPGKAVTVTGIDLSRYRAGKMVEYFEVFDALGMMQQLGVIPAPVQAR